MKIGSLEVGEKPVLICTVLEQDPESIIRMANLAYSNGADCVELRADKWEKTSIPVIISEIKKPKLLSCRPKRYNGFFNGSEEERTELLLLGIKSGVDAVDVELKAREDLRQKLMKEAKSRNVPILVSYENFEKTPSKEELIEILKEEERIGADIAKIAVMAKSYEDALRVLEVALEAKRTLKIPFVAIAMGKLGSFSRPLSLKLGASATYCSVAKGKEGAPGQMTVEETKKILELLG